MKCTIFLCVAATVFAGCKGDVTDTSQPEAEHNSHSSTNNHPREIAGYESPQAAFAALQQAAETKDIPTFVRCLDDESQEMMATIMTLPLAFMAIDPQKKKDVNELLSKHGLSLEEKSEESPFKTTESRIAYITDVLQWLEQNADKTEQGPLNDLVDASLGKVTIEGDSAHATLTLSENQTDKMEFRRIDGNWFVHLPAPEFSSGPATGTSGSEPFDGPDFSAFGDDDPPPPIEAVPLEEYRSAWQVTLDVQDQPARELLANLSGDLGLEMDVNPALEQKLQQLVSLQVSEVSRFKAIEDVCRQIEVTPVYSESAIGFETGKREQPVVFAGPFLIELASFETDPETATGRLSLHAVTTGLPPTVMQILTDGMGPIQITGAADQNGDDLRRQDHSGAVGVMFDQSVFDREILIDLKNLLRSVETVSKLTGRVSFSLPAKVDILKFDELKPGVEKKAGGVTLTLERINDGSVAFKYGGTDNDNIHLVAFDSQGERVESFGGSSFGSGDSGQVSEEYQSAPARIEARIITQQEELEYEFNFEDIPVPNHSQMPEQLAELKFEGERPVSLQYVMLTGKENFRKAKFKATNHGNKDVERISMTLSYLDADGKELDDFPSSYGAEVISAGSSAQIEVSAPFMPEETRSVKAIVKSVEFTDATHWKAK